MFVEGLGWLTERESRWFDAEEGILSDWDQRQVASSWRPVRHTKLSPAGESFDTVIRPDRRWDPVGRFALPDLGLGAAVAWAIEGREIRPKRVPWVDA